MGASPESVADRADRLQLKAYAKGKVERIIREVKEDFLAWLTGQVFPERPIAACNVEAPSRNQSAVSGMGRLRRGAGATRGHECSVG